MGQAAAEGTIPANLIALTDGVLKAMFVNKLKRALALVLVLGVVALGLVGGIAMALGDKADPNAAPEPPKIPDKGGPLSAVVLVYNTGGEVVRVARFREPTEVESLEKCFPNYRERPSSNMAAGWKMGAEVFFNFPQGNTVRVAVAHDQDNGDPILWSVGKGDFRVAGDFYKMVPAGGKAIGTVGDEFGAWSDKVKGLKVRLILERGEKLNGTPLLTTYVEFSNVSGSAAPIVISWGDAKKNWVVTDGDGKEVPRYTGAVEELPSAPPLLVIPNGSVLRLNARRVSTGVGANKAAHLDLGGDHSWTFERPDKTEYFLGGTLVIEKANKDDWHGTFVLPKVRIPLARGDR
jgi:hypothetical protein